MTTLHNAVSVPTRNGPWHDLPPVPDKPLHQAAARALVRRSAARLPLRFDLPDGSVWNEHVTSPRVEISSEDFFSRLAVDGLAGLAESYMAGDWDTDDLSAALQAVATHESVLIPAWLRSMRRWYVPRRPDSEDNTHSGAKRNVSRHYDLSHDMFALFLDPSMTYSSALFRADESLQQAQAAKVDHLLDAVAVSDGTRLLDIGCGWGALAIRAAQRGAMVTALTISQEQHDVATARATAARVADRVSVELCDYRDATGEFDAIVSVEMIEAVGERYWPEYFSTFDRLLAPTGRVGLQAIVVSDHKRWVQTNANHTFVHKYIFPGGELASIPALKSAFERHTTLRVDSVFAFGPSYATTLRMWRDRFDTNVERVEALGFNETFQRMWGFYLAWAESGFATGWLDVVQMTAHR